MKERTKSQKGRAARTRGNSKEVRSAEIEAEEGWMVASRRHVTGAGDLLLVRWEGTPGAREWQKREGAVYRVRLVEVKATLRPYSNFPPADRLAMTRAGELHQVEVELAWWAPRASRHVIIPSREWPT